MRNQILAAVAVLGSCLSAQAGGSPGLDAMIERHAALNGVPASLVHRVVKAESGYNARASHAGNHGLMQIRHGTARGLGYRGGAGGLLDPETNLSYAVPYLAGAFRAARGNPNRAVAFYRSGYYRRGAPSVAQVPPGQLASAQAAISQAPTAPAEGNLLARLFGSNP
jgi:soluble lytic murein transglycosylase-like protein